jgi:uncharacterized protein involved in type VI secretion and phage assembly
VHQERIDPPQIPPAATHQLAEVVSVKDVHKTGRIDVKLLSYDGPTSQHGTLPARVCVPFAGAQRGAFLIPDVGDEVLISFVNGDPRQAVVLGGVWNGQNLPKEKLGGSGDKVDRWTFVGKAGTRIAIVEENGAQVIRLSTGATFAELSQGKIELSAGGSTVTVDSKGVTIKTGAKFEVTSTSAKVTAPTVDVVAGQSTFSGQVIASTVQTPAVNGASYTPGAGNVW